MPTDRDKKPVVHTRKHIARLERERRQTRLILYTFIAIMLAVIGLLGYGFLDLYYLQLQRPVAKVGQAQILTGDFEARVRLQRQQLLDNYSLYSQYQQFGLDVSAQLQQIQSQLDTPISVGQTVLDQMIEEELIRQEAAKRGLTVSQAELDEYIQGLFDFYPNGSPTPSVTATEVITPTIPAAAFEIVTITPTPSPTKAETATPTSTSTAEPPAAGTTTPASIPTTELLPSPTATLPEATATSTPDVTETPSPTATPYTREGFEKAFNQTAERLAKRGLSEADYRRLFENQLLREKLVGAITADIKPVQEQVWARHILVADEAIAQVIEDRLKAGEDFGEVAREVSQDTGSGANGGDLGWFGKGRMVAPFEEAAFSLEPGVISEPVKSEHGYHIIQVIARQNRPLTASELDQARQAAFQEWLTQAREDYGAETFDFWKERVPTDPDFITMATEAVELQKTAQAEEAQAGTSTPKPTP